MEIKGIPGKEQPLFKPYPHYIKVVKNTDNDYYRIVTNTHVIENVSDRELEYIAMPICGKSAAVQLFCEDKALRDRISIVLDKSTDLHIFLKHRHPVIKNIWANYLHMYANLDKFFSIRSIKGIAKEKPLLFIAAGPSLTSNLEIIRKLIAEDRIIAVVGGSAIRVLSQAGIYPQFSLAFDPTDREYTKVFSFISDEYFSRSTFIVTPGLATDCFRLVQHGLVACTTSLPKLTKWFEPEEDLVNEGRVGVSTMIPSLAKYMGAKTLYTIGVDMVKLDGKRYTDAEGEVSETADRERLKLLKKDDSKGFEEIIIEGITTTRAWEREATDIINQTNTLKIKLVNCSDISLFTKFKVKSGKLSSFFKGKRIKLDVHLKKKKQTFEEIVTKLSQIMSELLEMGSVEEGWKINKPMAIYTNFIQSYDMVQQFREVRTGDYNDSLLREVIRDETINLGNALKQAGLIKE